jgi:hypothetical protein
MANQAPTSSPDSKVGCINGVECWSDVRISDEERCVVNSSLFHEPFVHSKSVYLPPIVAFIDMPVSSVDLVELEQSLVYPLATPYCRIR